MYMSMKKPKYEILATFDSMSGVALKSGKRGDVVDILTHMPFLNLNNATDEAIIMANNVIYKMLAKYIFPLVLKTFSNETIPRDFGLYAVYVEMHNDKTKNKVLINEDTDFHIVCKLKKNVQVKKNDPVQINDIEYFTSVENPNKDHNAATIMLLLNSGGWFGTFDFIYNRENTKEKVDRAIDFFSSAKESLKNSNMNAFYDSLRSCSELLAESLLLLHNRIKLKTPHKKITIALESFCEAYNLEYIEDYKKLYGIRDSARYGPPHPKPSKSIKEARRILQTTNEFLNYVLNFLNENKVVPSSKQYLERIDISSIIQNK